LVAALCGVAVLCGLLLSTRTVEESSLTTKTEVVGLNDGEKLVAHARIVNNEGEDMNYTYHVLLEDSPGNQRDYSGTVLVRAGKSYSLTVNLYPEPGKSAYVVVRLYKGASVEPFEEFTFHFPPTASPQDFSKSRDA